jgi:elongation factor G
MAISTDSLRNVSIAGHGGTGKTSLVEHMLFAGGKISKPEPVESGRTVSDYTEEEVEANLSIHAAVANLQWKDTKINVIDTPGSPDFVGEVVAALRVSESTLLAVGARDGVEIETIKIWRRLEDRQLPRMVFINKMDEERADFNVALEDLGTKFDKSFVPVTIPIGSGADYRGVVSLIDMKAYLSPEPGSKEKAADIPEDMKDTVEDARASLIASAAEGDEELEMKYLEEEDLTSEEIIRGLSAGLRDNKMVPVLCGSAVQGSGVAPLLDFLSIAAPSPEGVTETALDADGNEVPQPITSDAPFSGVIFKTTIDQFSGKLSFIKVVTGTLSGDSELVVTRDQNKEKVSKVFTVVGKKLEDTDAANAGDIVVVAKLSTATTNDTVCSSDKIFELKPVQFPQPVHSVAFEAGSKKDEDKLSQMLQRYTEEDPTFIMRFNPETKETVLSGMGELHINMILDRIREKQKITVETKVPKVAYRETITKNADATYRHKKQSGGHGQFGEVAIRANPLPRGEEYSFENVIKGMAVSKGYIPGIEKGLHEAMESGILAGYPVVDVGVTLYDGKEHPVDSSEMAFKMAARGALKDAMSKAKPTLLEPVMDLEVFVDEQYLGDVLSDLSSRRGRVLGQEPLGGGIQLIKAQVPQAELLRYSIDLRSITSGTGGFEMSFSHYSPISGKVADDVIKAAEAAREEESA